MAKRHKVTSHTLAHWPMTGVTGANELDDSGNGHTLLDDPGNIPAVAFNPFEDGTTSRDCTAVGYNNEAFLLNPKPASFGGLSELTLSSHFYLADETAWMGSFAAVVFKAGQPPGGEQQLYIHLNKFATTRSNLNAFIECTGQDVVLADTVALAIGWHLVTVVFLADNYGKMFVDGAEKAVDLITSGNAVASKGVVGIGGLNHTSESLHGRASDTILEDVARDLSWHTAHFLGGNPIIIAEDGGYEVTVEGTFPAGVPLDVFLGPNGDATDSPCYGGQSRGYNPVSEDGTTLTVFSPPIAVGEERVLSWRQTGTGDPAFLSEVNVLERSYGNTIHRTRRSFPPWAGVGPRRIELEP